jgi:hypothetical protein
VIIVATTIITSSHLLINFDNNEDFEDEHPQKELKYNCNEISNSFDKSTIANVIIIVWEKKNALFKITDQIQQITNRTGV